MTAAQVVVVNSGGGAWLVDADRHAECLGQDYGPKAWGGLDPRARAVLASAAIPPECGPDIPVGPGRGPFLRFTPREMIVTDSGGIVARRAGYDCRDAMRIIDAFDVMTLQAKRAHQGKDTATFIPPFTNGQVSAGRDYAALSERVAASGVKCSSLETIGGGGSQGGDREAAIFRDIQRLRGLQRRIGNDLAKEVRRVRPSARGGDPVKRRAIWTRSVVDMVCLGGRSLNDVLRLHGWACKGSNRDALRKALCGALDRMQGYDLQKGY